MSATKKKPDKPDGRRKKKRERQDPSSWRYVRVGPAAGDVVAALLELEVDGFWPACVTPQVDGTVAIAAKHTGLVCGHCGDPQPPGTDPRRLYCSPSCRTMASRARTSGKRVENKNKKRFT